LNLRSVDYFIYSRIDENKHLQIGTNGRSSSTTLPEPQKPQPINRTERFFPATEQVKLKYEDRYLTSSIPSRKDLSAKVSTIKEDYEPSHPIIKPVNASLAETIVTRDNSEDDIVNYSGRRYQQPTSQIHVNGSYLPSFEPSNLPPPPEPGSSDSLIATPSESSPSIVTIQPPPTPPLITLSSNIDQQPSISSIATPLPPPPPPFQTSSPIDISNPPYQFRYPEAVIDNASSKSVPNSTTLSTKKANSSGDLLRSDMDTYGRGYAQYDSDINTADEGAFVKPSTSVGYGWKSEMNIYERGESRPNGSSDIDSDAEIPYQQSDRSFTKREEREPYEEFDIKAREKVLRFPKRETPNLPQSTISIEKREVRTSEIVPLSPTQIKEETEIEQNSTYSTMRRSGERENEHRMHKKLKPASNRTPSDPALRQQNMPSNRQSRVNVIGTWYNCAGCNRQLGSSDLMIIEELGLFYHLSCFNCSRCGIQLGDGQNETSNTYELWAECKHLYIMSNE
uniref:LIM zinc-binding domain-containing protein n=1 Tax=Hymenolepis diminuta TaxID=6216 RepID=A0A0R3SX38_HYMDI